VVTDADLMRRALFHAARAAGATTPNPMVGAVVLSPEGVIVGQGRHPKAGEPHAEVLALDDAGDRARGGTLYVTLEPCCHFGRTAPCTRRVIASGVSRVVIAMEDPNPLVNGQGVAELRAAGIMVEVGLLETEARRLNAPFITVQTCARPAVILKVAVSADGRIAARPGARTVISSAPANRRVQRLRAVVDAIAVGSETVLVDDPLLTVRESVRPRPLVRAVFDRRLRTPPSARVLTTLSDGPVIILTSAATIVGKPERVHALTLAGATVVPGGERIETAIRSLLAYEVSSVLVEGGATIHRALLDADVVDTAHVIVAPISLGADGVPVFGTGIIGVPGVEARSVERVGPDDWMEFDVHGNR
jgi:diaminohydroxyphosphoribosylaminopyrimidine deaminase / 5-amino-6-(5-phosphoribosylamino)uracil reductase